MQWLLSKKTLVVGALIAVLLITYLLGGGGKKIDYSADVKPIINNKCITCHGGVRAKAGFSLLFRDEALAKTKSGKPAIIPGHADESEMIRRLTLTDPEERMPYQHTPLSKEEINILTKWIDQGAQWGEHWSYKTLQPVEVPVLKKFFGLFESKSAWAKNEIDYFILKKLKEEDLSPSAEADKRTLLRRISLDLIGMPADETLTKKFLSDNSNAAYESLVDSLLASKHFGEKWASMWLDLARYADTKGYERDDSRSIWKYRDWVIDAFNADMPYNEFLKEQIAGDLLPDPTDAQYIATAFHRNTMTNDEGGTDNEEFRTAAVLDRVNTTWEAVMGTTFGCVQCHSHPYDPFKHDEYYKFLAFFNDSRDEDTEADYPLLRQFDDSTQNELDKLTKWLQKNISAEKAKEVKTFIRTWQPAVNSLLADSFTNSELSDTKWLAFRRNAVCRLRNIDLTNKTQILFRHSSMVPGGTWNIHIDDVNGPVIASIQLQKHMPGFIITAAPLQKTNGVHHLYFNYTNPNVTNDLDNAVVFDWFYFTQDFPGNDLPDYTAMKNLYWKLMCADAKETIPVMMNNPTDMHRASYVFERGNWMVKGDKMTPAVPASLNKFPANEPANRLGLAYWMIAKDNPLTSRTIVNRMWEQIFGTGLAETLEDLGTQGVAPTHPELLNWLSYRFVNDDDWSLKALVKKMVMSATYMQSSATSDEQLKKDPANKFYSRASRVRLSAEQIRDQALCIAGVMSSKMYGPGVFPYQPKGIWLSPWNGADWVQSTGENQYRRAVYTYWKRSAAYPSMITFDGAVREVCSARRIRTNTPLQALTTLNDEVYMDAARQFAYRVQKEAGTDVNKQIAKAYSLATHKEIDDKSMQALIKLYNTAYTQFKDDESKTCEMVGGMNKSKTNAASASLMVVTNAILNLDEVVTKS